MEGEIKQKIICRNRENSNNKQELAEKIVTFKEKII